MTAIEGEGYDLNYEYLDIVNAGEKHVLFLLPLPVTTHRAILDLIVDLGVGVRGKMCFFLQFLLISRTPYVPYVL